MLPAHRYVGLRSQILRAARNIISFEQRITLVRYVTKTNDQSIEGTADQMVLRSSIESPHKIQRNRHQSNDRRSAKWCLDWWAQEAMRIDSGAERGRRACKRIRGRDADSSRCTIWATAPDPPGARTVIRTQQLIVGSATYLQAWDPGSPSGVDRSQRGAGCWQPAVSVPAVAWAVPIR